MMGTEVSVQVWHESTEDGLAVIEDAFAEVERIEGLMSTYIEGSEISEINRAAADAPVAAGDELIQLILRSLDISMLTRGAFDITYDSVGQYYDFRERQRPNAETIEEGLEQIDYRLVEVDRLAGTVRFLAPGVRINLGGIAKGYAVERAVSLLRSRGILHGIVTAGGDSRLLGDRRGQPFMVGIRDPRKDDEVALTRRGSSSSDSKKPSHQIACGNIAGQQLTLMRTDDESFYFPLINGRNAVGSEKTRFHTEGLIERQMRERIQYADD